MVSSPQATPLSVHGATHGTPRIPGTATRFYHVDLEETPSGDAACPRCSLPLIVIPEGTAVVRFHLALGEALDYLRNAADMIEAARASIEEAVAP